MSPMKVPISTSSTSAVAVAELAQQHRVRERQADPETPNSVTAIAHDTFVAPRPQQRQEEGDRHGATSTSSIWNWSP